MRLTVCIEYDQAKAMYPWLELIFDMADDDGGTTTLSDMKHMVSEKFQELPPEQKRRPVSSDFFRHSLCFINAMGDCFVDGDLLLVDCQLTDESKVYLIRRSRQELIYSLSIPSKYLVDHDTSQPFVICQVTFPGYVPTLCVIRKCELATGQSGSNWKIVAAGKGLERERRLLDYCIVPGITLHAFRG